MTRSSTTWATGFQIAISVAGALACLCEPASAQLRAVAIAGETAPGGARAFGTFGLPKINASGSVAFEASLAPDDFNPSLPGMWSEGDGVGALRNVALKGDAAPGGNGATFLTFEQLDKNLYLNDLGDVAFMARLSDQSIGLWTDRERPTNALTKIVRGESNAGGDGDEAPATAGPRHFQSGFTFRGMGDIHSGAAFMGILTVEAAPNNFPSSGVFNEGFAVVLDKVAQTASTAPGTVRPSIGGGLALFTQVFAPTINDSGHVAFTGETNAGVSVGALGAAGVWTNSNSGALRKVALAGESAPGTATTFSSLFRDATVINHAGDVAFLATLTGLINGDLREGIWVERDGSVQKVAFESEAASGTASTFSSLSDALLDEEGRAVFGSQLADGRDGLWRETAPGALAKVALQGELATGTSLNFLNILDYAVNRSGQIAFKSQLSDIGSDGIFTTDASGTLRKIVASGDTISVLGEQFTVESLDFHGVNGSVSAAGMSSGFNDQGQVAFFASLSPTDNYPNGVQGIFVADGPIAVPETSADFDSDGDVDGADFLTWQRGVGMTGATRAQGNANEGEDDDVDGDDLAVWQSQFGASTPAGAPVPEPAAARILLIAAALAWCGRHRLSPSRRRR